MTPTQKLNQLETLIQKAKLKQIQRRESMKGHTDNPQIKEMDQTSQTAINIYQDILNAINNDWVMLNITAE